MKGLLTSMNLPARLLTFVPSQVRGSGTVALATGLVDGVDSACCDGWRQSMAVSLSLHSGLLLPQEDVDSCEAEQGMRDIFKSLRRLRAKFCPPSLVDVSSSSTAMTGVLG